MTHQSHSRGRATVALMTALLTCLALAACGGSSSGGGGDVGGVDLPFIDTDSALVKSVKNGYIKACPTATVGEMADAFFPDAAWSDFTSTTGEDVVELTGMMSYDGSPARATLQFTVDPMDGFSASYVEIGSEPGNLLMISALLTKMCEAT